MLFNRALKILVIILLVCSVVSLPVYALSIGSGDTNSDNKVDALDLKNVLMHYLNSVTTSLDQYADGKINIFDFVLVLRRLNLPTTSLYVSPTGSDANPGSLASPFKTVQKCASVATPGTTCYLRAGTYRETVIPPTSGSVNQPIVFTNFNGETATVSGADLVPTTAWSVDSGPIYKSVISPTFPEGLNQVFLDGKMMTEARWPNSTALLDRTTWAHAQSGASTSATNQFTLSDVNFSNQPSWAGGNILFTGNGQWYSGGGIVDSSTNGQITFHTTTSTNDLPNNPYTIYKTVPYILFGKRFALDSPSEWFLDSTTKTLYFETPTTDSPALHQVEYKNRQYAFDLSAKSNIQIVGLNIFASTIKTDAQSSQITIDSIKAQYLSHNLLIPGTTWNYESGIVLAGVNNTIKNSELSYSSGSGIQVYAASSSGIINNVIHNMNYSASAMGAITFRSRSPLNIIKNNTIFDTGSSAIYSPFYNTKILNNNLYNSCLLVRDHGIIYTSGDAGGSEIAYNLMHDNKADYLGVGFYVDSGWPGNVSANYILHHNVVWNADYTGLFLKPNAGGEPPNYQAYNNTVENVPVAIEGTPSGPIEGKAYNNLSTKGIYATDSKSNLVSATPGYINSANNNYQLQSTSPAINAGVAIPGITDGFVGTAPDIGAFEYGATPWTAGANFAPSL